MAPHPTKCPLESPTRTWAADQTWHSDFIILVVLRPVHNFRTGSRWVRLVSTSSADLFCLSHFSYPTVPVVAGPWCRWFIPYLSPRFMPCSFVYGAIKLVSAPSRSSPALIGICLLARSHFPRPSMTTTEECVEYRPEFESLNCFCQLIMRTSQLHELPCRSGPCHILVSYSFSVQ